MQHFEDGQHPIAGARLFSAEYTWTDKRSKQRFKDEIARYHKMYNKYPRYNL